MEDADVEQVLENDVEHGNEIVYDFVLGGALLYIKEDCNVKPLPKLDRIMYKPKHLESVFVEICNKNNKIYNNRLHL